MKRAESMEEVEKACSRANSSYPWKRAMERAVPGWQLQFPIIFCPRVFCGGRGGGQQRQDVPGQQQEEWKKEGVATLPIETNRKVLTCQSPKAPNLLLSFHHNLPMGHEVSSSGTTTSHLQCLPQFFGSWDAQWTGLGWGIKFGFLVPANYVTMSFSLVGL